MNMKFEEMLENFSQELSKKNLERLERQQAILREAINNLEADENSPQELIDSFNQELVEVNKQIRLIEESRAMLYKSYETI